MVAETLPHSPETWDGWAYRIEADIARRKGGDAWRGNLRALRNYVRGCILSSRLVSEATDGAPDMAQVGAQRSGAPCDLRLPVRQHLHDDAGPTALRGDVDVNDRACAEGHGSSSSNPVQNARSGETAARRLNCPCASRFSARVASPSR